MATLDYGLRGGATGVTSDGTWELGRATGFLHAGVSVTEQASGREVASLDIISRARGGSLQLEGTTYEMDVHGWMHPGWMMERAGEPLLSVRRQGFLQSGAAISLTPAGRADTHGSLLVLIAFHAMVTEQRRSSHDSGMAVTGS